MNIFKGKKASIDAEIRHLLMEMKKVDPKSEDYAKLAHNLDTVTNAAKNRGIRINWEQILVTALTAGSSIGGMILVLNYEKIGVIATKAFGLVPKGRV